MNFIAGRVGNECVTGAVRLLARKVVRTMLVRRLMVVALALVISGALLGGGSYWASSLASTIPPEGPRLVRKVRDQVVAKSADDAPAPGRMFVTGRVLDPGGNPVAGATIVAYVRGKIRGRSVVIISPARIGEGRSNDSGLYRLDAARTGSSQHENVGAIATAPGYGAGWVELDPDAEKPEAEIRLLPEQVIQGRLFDVQGRPVQRVDLAVSTMSRGVQSIRGPREDGVEGARPASARRKTAAGWPQPAVTDADGRFTVRGVGRGFRVSLEINDPRFAVQSVDVDTDDGPGPKEIKAALEPAQFVSGRITYADSGEPARGARVFVQSSISGRIVPLEVRTDAEGRFRANAARSDRRFRVTAFPPPRGQPYLSLSQEFDWPKGAVEHAIDLALPRGIVLAGKVLEEGSGKPVARASLRFISREEQQGRANSGSPDVDSELDGSFQLAALPSPGYLSVMGPSDDFVLQAFDGRLVDEDRFGGRRYYWHGAIFLDLKPGCRARSSTWCSAAVRRSGARFSIRTASRRKTSG